MPRNWILIIISVDSGNPCTRRISFQKFLCFLCCEGENSAWKVMLYKLCLYYEYVKFMLVMRYSSEISSMLKTRNKECNHTDTTHKGKGEFAKIQNIQVSVTQEYVFSRLRISCKYPCLGIDLFRTFNSPL